ncbi:MAG: hypothetical protein HY401_02035 [Elusimicrobia bacterium]|nr:hypothetical protein [Elusimicrobiota bacterium]
MPTNNKTQWTQYTVPLTNTPGTLAKLTQTLSTAEVNITSFTSEGWSDVAWFRFLAKDPNATTVLEKAGYKVYTHPAIEVELTNKPGELNKLAATLGEKGINIWTTYGTTATNQTSGRIVVVVDQPEKALPVLDTWKVKATTN